MKLTALNRTFSDIFLNQRNTWHVGIGSNPCLQKNHLEQQKVQPTRRLHIPENSNRPPELKVEDVKVSSDRQYMYCEGSVRSSEIRTKSNVVVAVEWLDKDRKALNTDWKRVEMHLNGETVAMPHKSGCPFMVKAALDRRVKWVKAYAFSGSR